MSNTKPTLLENSAITLPSLGGLLLLFVGAAFTLVGFIYTTGQSDTQKRLDDLTKKVETLQDNVGTIMNAQTLQSSRSDRQGERIDENRKQIENNKKDIQDLQKAAILSNANAR